MRYQDLQTEEKAELQKEIIQLAKKSKRKKKVISALVVCFIFILAFLFAWIAGQYQAKKKTESEINELTLKIQQQQDQIDELRNTPIVVNPVSPEIVLKTLHSEINNIGELATIEYLFTDSAKFSDSKQIKNWNIPFTSKAFIIKWDGVIKAGVNLEELSCEVNEEEKKIIISIPKAEILSYETNSSSVEVLNQDDNIFNPITIDDKIQFDAQNEKAMKQRAIENGILEKAQKNAEEIITRLLTASSEIGDNYMIEFSIVGN